MAMSSGELILSMAKKGRQSLQDGQENMGPTSISLLFICNIHSDQAQCIFFYGTCKLLNILCIKTHLIKFFATLICTFILFSVMPSCVCTIHVK